MKEVGAGFPCPVVDLPDCNWREFLLWLSRRRRRFRVQGDSMLPLLQEGEELLIGQYTDQYSPQVGDVVVAQHPKRANLQIIKRVAAITPSDTYVLQGDNLVASTDSRHYGPVARSLILGRVTCRFG